MPPWSACPKSEAILFLFFPALNAVLTVMAILLSAAAHPSFCSLLTCRLEVYLFFNIRLIPSDMPSFQSFSNFWYMMYILSLWEEYNASKYQHYSVNSLKQTCNWVCKALESEFLSILFKWILQVRLAYFLGFTLFFLFEESLTPLQMLESFYQN